MTTRITEANASRRAQLRDFLRSRRARVSPERVGLPAGPRRRTPGLRREELAVLAGVGVSWYTWLEQGRAIRVSGQVLDAISSALLLDETERHHLYLLAGLNPPAVPSATAPSPATPELRRLVDAWLPNPAHILDRHWNFVLVNEAAAAVFGYPGADGNCLRSFFTDPGYRTGSRHWDDTAAGIVAEFRADAARFPDDPVFPALVERLRSDSPEFATLWSRHDVRVGTHGVKEFHHAEAGRLVFEHSVLRFPDRPELRLVLHLPDPATGTRDTLERLLGNAPGAEDHDVEPARATAG
ncbi:helix-turn-helix transcriptional regulator [Actinoalloteichus spitiensis]|uniref:helix-turn-helix transcriptional regulator n=1 Tax=Actinoalloteichus spitiensis TaxID=252394 RepID=UPI000382783D|nr:helix-turn-helix transcriptional regulator [Actinoalloteichus spitiensis]